jgi:hypothetical protein
MPECRCMKLSLLSRLGGPSRLLRLLPLVRGGGGGGAVPSLRGTLRLMASTLCTLSGRRTDVLRLGGGGGAASLGAPGGGVSRTELR